VDIAAWLRGLGLERYEQAFRDSGVDFDVLGELSEPDLDELGMLPAHRNKLLKAIVELATTDQASARVAGPAPDLVGSKAERRQLTVMFCELVGSTELSAKLDPEDLGEVRVTCQKCCTDVVTRWGGHLAKTMGDGVLAYFGWPRAHEDDPERAVRAGLALVDAVGMLTTPSGGTLAARVGIATGLVVVGDLIRTDEAREEAVVGETPNLAARLRELAGPGAVVIAPTTRRLVGGLFELIDLGPQRLKGFAEPMAAFRVEGEGHAESRFEALHRSSLTPLIGREPELALLLKHWAVATDGAGQVVLVSGEPGIGKSRLIRALRDQLSGESHIAVSCFCSPHHTHTALHPIISHLERAARFAPDDAPEARLSKLEALLGQASGRLDEAVPLIGALLDLPSDERYPPLHLSPQRQKQRLLEVLFEQLAGLARDRPVLALYEDVHWSDPSTLELLDILIERVPPLPVLVVITYRPLFSPPWTGQAHVSGLSLNHLSRRETAAMVGYVTGSKPLPAEVLQRLLAKTDGVPLFVEELTKAVLESGLLADAGNHYELSGPLPPLAIPATLHDSLLARLDHLARVKEVAQLGAAIGREFSHALLAAVGDRPEPELHAALDQLVQSGLIFRRGASPDATYIFKHVLVQDAAYGTLLKSRRQQLHARIAQVLEEKFPDVTEAQPELLANHCTEAGLIETAVQYWRRAGQRAVQRSANAEAIDHLNKGLELLETSLGPALLATRGFASKDVEATYSAARALCQQLSSASTDFSVLRGLWVYYFIRADLSAAHDLASQLLKLAEMDGRSGYFLEAHRVLGQTLIYQGDVVASRSHLEQALALYDPHQHRSHIYLYGNDSAIVCSSYLAYALWFLGFQDQALKTSRETMRHARQLAHPFSLALALAFAAYLHQNTRDAAATIQLAEEAISLSTEQGFPFWAKQEAILSGWALAKKGQIEDGSKRLQEGLNDYRKMGSGLACPWFLGLLAEVHAEGGRLNVGLEALEEALMIIERTGEKLYLAEIYRLRGEMATAREDLSAASQAEHDYRRALDIARQQGAKSWELRAATSLARLWAEQGERQKARDLLAPVYEWFTEGFDTADLKDAKTLLDELS
jgi:class 3 adenylate cyclase/predicted ATPase